MAHSDGKKHEGNEGHDGHEGFLFKGQCRSSREARWRKRLGVEPSLPRKEAATDFEDREGHRAPFTSGPIISGRDTVDPVSAFSVSSAALVLFHRRSVRDSYPVRD
jgi:hypothetical protein